MKRGMVKRGNNTEAIFFHTDPRRLSTYVAGNKGKGVQMKIKVEYNPFAQTEFVCGNFIFIKDEAGVIRNLEARW